MPSPPAGGGVVSVSPEGVVVYKPPFNAAVGFTDSFTLQATDDTFQVSEPVVVTVAIGELLFSTAGGAPGLLACACLLLMAARHRAA